MVDYRRAPRGNSPFPRATREDEVQLLPQLAKRDGFVTRGGKLLRCKRCGGNLAVESLVEVVCLMCGQHTWGEFTAADWKRVLAR